MFATAQVPYLATRNRHRTGHQISNQPTVQTGKVVQFLAGIDKQGGRDFDAIARARQEHSGPILGEFKNWLEGELNGGRILPKSLIKSAFTYTLTQWNALCR
ncbi:MAG: transposase, partial [Pirellula sp.]